MTVLLFTATGTSQICLNDEILDGKFILDYVCGPSPDIYKAEDSVTERFKDVMLLSLKMEEGDMSQGIQVASRS